MANQEATVLLHLQLLESLWFGLFMAALATFSVNDTCQSLQPHVISFWLVDNICLI